MKKTLVLIIAVAAMIVSLPNVAKANAADDGLPNPVTPIAINNN